MHAKARATMFFRRACELGDAKVSAFLFPFLFSFLFSFRFHFRFPVPVLCLAGCVLCGFGTWQITQEAWPSEARIPWCKHGTDQACHRASMSKMRGGLLTRLMRRDAIASSSLRMRSRCAALSQCRLPRAVCYNLHAQAACARRSWRVPLEPAMWQQAMCTKALSSSHVHQCAWPSPGVLPRVPKASCAGYPRLRHRLLTLYGRGGGPGMMSCGEEANGWEPQI